jgi:hypothetical protein
LTGKTWWLKFANGCPLPTAHENALGNETRPKKHKIPIDLNAFGRLIFGP